MKELGFSRDFLPEHLKNLLNNTNLKICEIGVFEGNYSEIILSSIPDSELNLIDLWDPENNDFFYSDFDLNQFQQAYKKVKNRFEDKKNVKIIKGDSRKIYSLFEDQYFDWVYIDGDHSYEGVYADLKNWTPKVKVGGVISGHDFNPDPSWSVTSNFGVNKAIDEFFGDTSEIYLTNEQYYKSWVHFKR
jgi:hypothetical protein